MYQIKSTILTVPVSKRDGFYRRTISGRALGPEGFPAPLPPFEEIAKYGVFFGGDLGFSLNNVLSNGIINLSIPLLSADILFELVSELVKLSPQYFIFEIPSSARRYYITASGETLLFDPFHTPVYSDALKYCWQEMNKLSNTAHDQLFLAKWLKATACAVGAIPFGFFARNSEDHDTVLKCLHSGTNLGRISTSGEIPSLIEQYISTIQGAR